MFLRLSAWFSNDCSKEIRNLWSNNGGIEAYDARSAYFMFVSNPGSKEAYEQIIDEYYEYEGLYCISVEWIKSCIQIGKMIECLDYTFSKYEVKKDFTEAYLLSCEEEEKKKIEREKIRKQREQDKLNNIDNTYNIDYGIENRYGFKKLRNNIFTQFYTSTNKVTIANDKMPEYRDPLINAAKINNSVYKESLSEYFKTVPEDVLSDKEDEQEEEDEDDNDDGDADDKDKNKINNYMENYVSTPKTRSGNKKPTPPTTKNSKPTTTLDKFFDKKNNNKVAVEIDDIDDDYDDDKDVVNSNHSNRNPSTSSSSSSSKKDNGFYLEKWGVDKPLPPPSNGIVKPHAVYNNNSKTKLTPPKPIYSAFSDLDNHKFKKNKEETKEEHNDNDDTIVDNNNNNNDKIEKSPKFDFNLPISPIKSDENINKTAMKRAATNNNNNNNKDEIVILDDDD